ncbi:Alpha/Beta hydrolase protein [Zychaea mexicana]|uniref:Alpha/Beta hydrolase protein n=1 Tax=Zychaea mexicana TaxID=64656 RepID=UPI0022FE0A03|nr:Alpha/Beta hydrolase protein [Zychaea mexicana]KAI9495063.1 Alpha/Beta hydrolase protein [Zychaea mexicana]
MEFFWVLRRWFITFLLRVAFSWGNRNHSARIIQFLGFLLPFNRRWVREDTDHGTWIAEDIAGSKKEAISDRLEESNVVIMWVSGGGFRFDMTLLYIRVWITWIRALEADKNMRCVIFVPKYKTGHPFPAAVNGVKAAYDWLVNTMHIPTSKLIIGGDDAGAAVALDLMHLHKPKFAGAIFASPYTGLEAGGESWRANMDIDFMTAAAVDRMEESYIPEEGDQPFRYLPDQVDLATSLPRHMLITVGGNEVLLDEAGYLASRARAGGVAVTLCQAPDQTHLWSMLPDVLVQDVNVRQNAVDHFVRFVELCVRPGKH